MSPLFDSFGGDSMADRITRGLTDELWMTDFILTRLGNGIGYAREHRARCHLRIGGIALPPLPRRTDRSGRLPCV